MRINKPKGLFIPDALKVWCSDLRKSDPRLLDPLRPLLAAALWALATAWFGVALAQVRTVIGTPPLDLLFTGLEVHATGSWVARLNRGAIPISSVNAVEIHCDRASMTCRESRAEVASQELRPARQGTEAQHLSIVNQAFTVTEWTDARITARSDTPTGDLMLRILPSERLIRLSYWDTRLDGNRKDPPTGFLWELQ